MFKQSRRKLTIHSGRYRPLVAYVKCIDNGYDVWLGNNRGNGYSMKNKYYTPNQDEFWDFSWDEMAAYDLPTQIEYVLKTTGQSQIPYIGHSEGTTQAFAGFLNPNVSKLVSVFIAMAPAVYVSHTGSLLVKALAELDTVEIFNLLGVQEFALTPAVHSLLPGICNLFPSLCDFGIR
jgi:pimeloyl-ACP methyl ester carboxylesterase